MPPVFKKGASLKGPSFFENRAPPPPCLFGDPGGCLAKCPRAVCPFRVVAVGWRLARLGAAPRVQPTREEKFALFLHGRCGGWLRGLGQARVRLLLLALRASPAPARQGRAVVWCHQALAGELLLSPGPPLLVRSWLAQRFRGLQRWACRALPARFVASFPLCFHNHFLVLVNC